MSPKSNYRPLISSLCDTFFKKHPRLTNMKSLFLAIILAACSSTAFATVRTWDGGGADSNWMTAAHWADDVAPVANDYLVFPQVAAQFATNNNFPIQTNFNSISIAGGYTINGSSFRLGGGGLSVSTGTVTINAFANLSAAATLAAGTGTTTTVAFLNVGSFPLRIEGAGSFGIGLITGSGGINKV